MEKHARSVEIAQVHLGKHLLRYAAVHGDRKRLRREVVERNLLPQRQAETVGQDREHLVGRMVVDPDQVGVDSLRAGEDRCDLVDGGQGSATGSSLSHRKLPLLVKSYTVENDRVSIEKEARAGGVDSDLSQAKARIEVVDRQVVRDHSYLKHVERRKARTPQIGGADREWRGDAKDRVSRDLADVHKVVEQRLRVGGNEI